MNVKINYLPGFKNIVADYLGRNLQEQDPWKPLNSFHISNITLEDDYLVSKFINLMHNGAELETLFKDIEENHKEKIYVTKTFKKYLSFIFIEDVLKIKFKNKFLLVVPKSLRYEIISWKLSHSEWYSGHFEIFQTAQRICNKYWWPTVNKEVINFILTCKICLSIKTPDRPRGKINDHFTKLIKLYAIKDRKALTASACLHDNILTYGIPSKILTDQDLSFESKLFQELCNSLGIKKTEKIVL